MNGEVMSVRLVNTKCANCGKGMVVQEGCLREKMFCTLGCLETFKGTPSGVQALS